MVRSYLRNRPTLKEVCVLIDARHGIKAIDQDTMEMLDQARVPYALVLTKADKIKPAELSALMAHIAEVLANHPAKPPVFATSSEKKTGLGELRAFLFGNYKST
jgi:GTP-binding protein